MYLEIFTTLYKFFSNPSEAEFLLTVFPQTTWITRSFRRSSTQRRFLLTKPQASGDKSWEILPPGLSTITCWSETSQFRCLVLLQNRVKKASKTYICTKKEMYKNAQITGVNIYPKIRQFRNRFFYLNKWSIWKLNLQYVTLYTPKYRTEKSSQCSLMQASTGNTKMHNGWKTNTLGHYRPPLTHILCKRSYDTAEGRMEFSGHSFNDSFTQLTSYLI